LEYSFFHATFLEEFFFPSQAPSSVHFPVVYSWNTPYSVPAPEVLILLSDFFIPEPAFLGQL
jgi:hypothetical protein